jgi:hypothetical protein
MLHRFELTSDQVRVTMVCLDAAMPDLDEEAFEVALAVFNRFSIEAERARQHRERG